MVSKSTAWPKYLRKPRRISVTVYTTQGGRRRPKTIDEFPMSKLTAAHRFAAKHGGCLEYIRNGRLVTVECYPKKRPTKRRKR